MGIVHTDVVVVGGGHAGCEAAAAASRCGAQVILVTHRLATIGALSCNPAIGGIGKGHLVREIDALDGLMARAADRAGIHFKVLNRRKGPAVHGPRAQMDRALYAAAIRDLLAACVNLTLHEAAIEDLLVDATRRVNGVVCEDGTQIHAGAVVITTGTFLHGTLHTGGEQRPGGRIGEPAAIGLGDRLTRLGLPMGRLKTGTPPRIRRSSIDWDGLEADWGDAEPEPMSVLTSAISRPQLACRVTATGKATHDIVNASMHLSAIRNGQITSAGPRYCPSIEDKVTRFPGRASHQVFLEPEGLESDLVYPNGISTSLPANVQLALVRSIPGLRHAEIVQAGYAVEYGFCDPRGLHASLEARTVRALFLAGQINGTTGYEEAAAQGILAGINAARLAGRQATASISRATAYIGVMIDDLTTAGVTEPYRMFTSRSEFRLSLRADNAPSRLTALGQRWNVIGEERLRFAASESEALAAARLAAETIRHSPTAWRRLGIRTRDDGRVTTLFDVLSNGSLAPDDKERACALLVTDDRTIRALCHDAVYHRVAVRQSSEIRAAELEHETAIPEHFYAALPGSFSSNTRRILMAYRPHSIGAAARLEGMTPAAVAGLMHAVSSCPR